MSNAQWLNTLLAKTWPFLDVQLGRAVAGFLDVTIKEQLVFREVPLHSVVIQELSFGSRPLKIEGIHTMRDGSHGMRLEIKVSALEEARLTLMVQLGHGCV